MQLTKTKKNKKIRTAAGISHGAFELFVCVCELHVCVGAQRKPTSHLTQSTKVITLVTLCLPPLPPARIWHSHSFPLLS